MNKLVTAEEVRASVKANRIMKIDHHRCSMCEHMVFYSVVDGSLFFNGGCGCGWEPPVARSWQSAADWINMQSNETHRLYIMGLFGLGK